MNIRDFSNPWGAVYRADRDGKIVGDGPAFGRSTSPWRLYSVFVSQTRYWLSSSARIVITRPIYGKVDGIFGQHISIEDEFEVGDGVNPYPGLEEPIAIEAGYANALYTDTNIAVRGRIFFGYIETIMVDINKKGIKVTLNCRDSMRFLIDNKFSGQIFGKNGKIYPQTGFDDFRSLAKPLNFSEANAALGVSDSDPEAIGAMGLNKHKVIAWLIYAGSNGGCLPGTLIDNGDSFSGSAIEKSARLLSADKEAYGAMQGFNVMNRSPMEVIKHLGSLEAEPREFFASMDDGRINWRRRETRGLDNPWEFSALIPLPDGRPPNVIRCRTDWSTIGTISELVVVNPVADVQNPNRSLNGSGIMNVSGRLPDDRFFPDLVPVAFKGIRSFTRRTRYIFDDTMSSNDPAGAMKLIEAMLRIWGKDLRAGSFTAVGNPYIRPGDAMRIYNFGLFHGEVMRGEAVEHHIIAAGPSKGYTTKIAFAETDEERMKVIAETINRMGTGDSSLGRDRFFINEDTSERAMMKAKLGNVTVSNYDGGLVQ